MSTKILQTKAFVCVCRLWTPLQLRLPDNSRCEICLWVSYIMRYLEKNYSISSDFICLVQLFRQCLQLTRFGWLIIHREILILYLCLLCDVFDNEISECRQSFECFPPFNTPYNIKSCNPFLYVLWARKVSNRVEQRDKEMKKSQLFVLACIVKEEKKHMITWGHTKEINGTMIKYEFNCIWNTALVCF